jgi:hypothetical protein
MAIGPGPQDDGCEGCLFWAQDVRPDYEEWGTCQRFAPRPRRAPETGREVFFSWPRTIGSDFCGEFQPRHRPADA